MIKKLEAFVAARKQVTITLILAAVAEGESIAAEPVLHAIVTPKPVHDDEIAPDEQPLKFTGTAAELEESIPGGLDKFTRAVGQHGDNLAEILAGIESEKERSAEQKRKADEAAAASKAKQAKKKTATKKTATKKPAAKKPAASAAPAAKPKAPAAKPAPATPAPVVSDLDSLLD